MSLNHKRRIFRPSPLSLPSLADKLPPPGVLMAAAGVVAALLLVGTLFVGSSEAPAYAFATSQITAGPDHVAVLDAATIKVGDQLVRLEGIVAPARGSLCHGPGEGDIYCGAAAANALAAMIRGSAVSCAIHGGDSHGRPAGGCMAAGRQLNQALVLEGWARAETAEMHGQETIARLAGRGIWRGGS